MPNLLRERLRPEGTPASVAHALYLHGAPTNSDDWLPFLERSGGFAPDLPGFGRSDKPTDLDWYSYDRHVESVAPLLDDLDLRDATVVVHDWGGPI